MIQPLADLRIVELSAFVAAPLGSMTLAQMGADVIRIDPIGGNIDFRRWPLAPSGQSLSWAGLNTGKRSVAVALDTPAGRALARALITAPQEGGGILLRNLPDQRWNGHATLQAVRAALISLCLTPGSPLAFEADQLLKDIVGCLERDVGRLHDHKIVAAPEEVEP